MACKYCDGSGEHISVVTHKYTGKKVTISVPCFCLTSDVVSKENKLLGNLGKEYIHPDKLDPQLVFYPDDLTNSPNLFITGDFSSLKIHVKALMMRHRFQNPKPLIMFSRSIDILHDYHVPDGAETAKHISALSKFSLIIVVFGIMEKNAALSACMSQMVGNRKDEGKPTWIYLPHLRPNLSACEQETSTELQELTKSFKTVAIRSEESYALKESANKDLANLQFGN